MKCMSLETKFSKAMGELDALLRLEQSAMERA
jgi:hypothetical protein